MRLQNHVLQFASNDSDVLKLLKSFGDYYNHYLSMKGIEGIDFSKEVSFKDKEDAINNAIVKEVVKRSGLGSEAIEDIGSFADSPTVRWATFAVITNLIDTAVPVSLDRLITPWADIQYGGYGDTFKFVTGYNGFLKVTRSGRAQRLAERQRLVKGEFYVQPEPHMLTLETDLYRLLLGLDSLAEMTAIVTRSMAHAIASEAFAAIGTAVAALPSGANGLLVNGYTQDDLARLITRVSAYSGGGVPWIMGSLHAVSRILPEATMASIPVDSDYFALGHVTRAMGSPVFVLPSAPAGEPYGTTPADDTIYILPSYGKPIKVGVGGQMRHQSGQFDHADLTQTTTMWKDFGVEAATGVVFGAIRLV